MGRVLVLGHDARAFLAVVRSLGRAGHEVDCAWHEAGGVALASKYLRYRHPVPLPRQGSTEWKHRLVGLLKEYAYDLVIPCTDAGVAALSEHAGDFAPYARLAVPAADVLGELTNKARAAELAERAGVRVAERRRVESPDDVDAAAAEWGYPLVVKPRQSHDLAAPGEKHEVCVASSGAEARAAFLRLGASGGVSVEKFFRGVGVAVGLLLEDGGALMAFQHERVHEPLRGGGSSYRRSVAVSPHLLEAALAVLQPLRYTGVAMVEFKVDAATGEWVFIEVNPRFWGSLPLALACGVDFPAALYGLFVEERRPTEAQYAANRFARNLSADLGWFRSNWRADREDPALITVPRRRAVWEWIQNPLMGRETVDTWALDDFRPAVAELRALWRKARVRGLGAAVGVGRRLVPTAMVAGRLRRRLARAERVLVVCRGNVCRSPFAAEWLRARMAGVDVRSAALLDRPGRRPPQVAIAEAAAAGVEIANHRSRTLRDGDLDWADVVLVFDGAIEREVLSRGARRVMPIWRLGDEAPVADPWGEPAEVFAGTYAKIVRLLESAVAGRAAAGTTPVRARIPVDGARRV